MLPQAVPKVKYASRLLMHTGTFVVYTAVLVSSQARAVEQGALVPPILPVEYVWAVCVFGNTLDFLYSNIVRRRLGVSTDDTSLKVVYGHIRAVCFLLAMITRLSSRWIVLASYGADVSAAQVQDTFAMDLSVSLYLWFTRIAAMGVVCVALAFLDFFSEYRAVGQLVIMFDRMVYATFPWMILFVVFIVGFMVAFLGFDAAGLIRDDDHPSLFALNNSATLDDMNGNPFYAAYMVPWWAAYGVFSDSHYDFFGAVFMWIYCLFAQVILVNLLVAIYAKEYDNVLESADVESASTPRAPLCLAWPAQRSPLLSTRDVSY